MESDWIFFNLFHKFPESYAKRSQITAQNIKGKDDFC